MPVELVTEHFPLVSFPTLGQVSVTVVCLILRGCRRPKSLDIDCEVNK